MAFDTYLKDIRARNNVNQTEMARILNISRTAIKLIENGVTKFPSKKVLSNIATYLDQPEIDVMAEILFTDIDLSDKKSSEYFVCHYLTHRYLEGWNITAYPFIFQLSYNYCNLFDAKITKKRETQNIWIVTTFQRELYRIEEVTSRLEALGFIGDLVSKLMAVLERFRGVQVLFDYNNKEDRDAYEIFEKLDFNGRNSYRMTLCLYDVTKDEIVKELRRNI